MTTIQSTEREELAELIANTECPALDPPWKERAYRSPVKYFSLQTADALLAAGYRKPGIVDSHAELEALGYEAVIRDADGHVLERWGGGDDELVWATVGVTNLVPADEITLPAVVLFEATA